VHDLCLDELSGVYPQRIRSYYLALLRINLNRASHVITVSDTSKNKLAKRYSVPLNQVSVVYNTVSNYFTNSTSAQAVLAFKSRFTLQGRFLLYSGGSEYRKNLERLVKAFGVLVEKQPDLTLLVTGNLDPRWNAALENTSPVAQSRVKFAGKLSESDLCLAYSAADTVVYPSLCEGFGRVCLEAMETGTPIACSNLPVMREVAGDYACWFDPFDNLSIVAAIEKALAEKRKEVVRDERFQAQAVKASFLDAMDRVTSQN
jgi:glycosyltransferase involved in cell wall biosynthesis